MILTFEQFLNESDEDRATKIAREFLEAAIKVSDEILARKRRKSDRIELIRWRLLDTNKRIGIDAATERDPRRISIKKLAKAIENAINVSAEIANRSTSFNDTMEILACEVTGHTIKYRYSHSAGKFSWAFLRFIPTIGWKPAQEEPNEGDMEIHSLRGESLIKDLGI